MNQKIDLDIRTIMAQLEIPFVRFEEWNVETNDVSEESSQKEYLEYESLEMEQQSNYVCA